MVPAEEWLACSGVIAPEHPWLAPYRPLLARLPTMRPGWPDHDALNSWFAAERTLRFRDEPELRFVDCPPRPRRRRGRGPTLDPCRFYDGRITVDREVPTRLANVHDFYNALVWLAFPRTKRALHARQFAALERWLPPGADTVPGRRTREQDALTLFDEGGAVILGALPASDAPSTVLAFGHALLEHFELRTNAIAATALHVGGTWDVGDDAFYDTLDRVMAARVTAPGSFLEPGLDALVALDAEGHAEPVPERPRVTVERV